MAKHTPLRHRSWRPQQLFGDQARQRRNLWRVIVTLGFVGLLAAFLMVVLRPLDHVRTRVMFLTSGPSQSVGARGVPYAGGALTALQALQPALLQKPTELPRLTGSESLRDIASALESGPSDAVVVFAAAEGLVMNGEPHLLGSSYSPSQPLAGAVPLQSMFAELKSQPAAVKLLVLDTGYEGYDPRNGRIVDDFVHHLGAAVQQNADPALWVMVSHASHEQPHVSPALRRTVFSLFITEGMRGAADANLDQQITVAELHRFVEHHVQAWVSQATSGRDSQTVRLLSADGTTRGGAQQRAARAPLLSVSNFELEQRAVDLDTAFAAANQYRESFPLVEVAAAPAKSLRDQLPALPHSANDYQSRRRQWERFLSAVSDSRLLPSDEAVATDSPPEKEQAAADEPAAGDADEGPTAFQQRTLELYRERTEVIHELLVLRDQVRQDIHHYRRVLARAPHLWREFETRLNAAWFSLAEQRVEATDQRFELLRQLLPTMRALAARQADLPSTRRGLPMRFANAWNHAEVDAVLADAGIVKNVFDNPLGSLLDENVEPDVAAFLKAAPASERSPEIQLLRALAARPQIPWSDQRLALQAELLSRQTAIAATQAVPWVQQQIDTADVYRHAALRDLLADVEVDDLDATRAKVQAACDHYLLAAETIQTVYVAGLVRDLCFYELPSMLTWASESLNAPPNQSIDVEQLGQLLSQAKALAQLLDSGDARLLPELKLELGLAIHQLQSVRGAFSPASLDQLVNTRLSADRSGIDAIIRSTLLSGASASALARNQLVLDAELVDGYQALPLVGLAAASKSDTGLAKAATQRRWEVYEALSHVELQLADFVSRSEQGMDDKLAVAVQQRQNAASRWSAAQQAESQVQDRLSSLPTAIDQWLAGANPQRLAQIHAAHRAMLVIDPRDTTRMTTVRPSEPLYSSTAYEFLRWRRRSLLKAQAFASDAQRQRLSTQAAQVARGATTLFADVPVDSDDRPRLAINTTVEGENEERGVIRVVLSNEDQSPLHCWVVADTNESSLELSLGAAAEKASAAALPASPVYSFLETQGRLQPESPPTLRIEPGANRELLLPFRLVGETLGPIAVQIRTVASVRGEIAQLADASMFSRQVIPIQADNRYDTQLVQLRTPKSPQLAFQIAGPKNSVEPREDGYRLLTFPNRDTRFQFSLTNQSSQSQKVTLQLMRPTQPPAKLPRGAVRGERADAILAALGPSTPVVAPISLEMEAMSTVPVPFAEMDGGDGDDTNQRSGPALSGVFVATLKVEGSDEVILRSFEIEVQHPRRYVLPTARYSSQRQRVELDLRMKPDAGAPTGSIPLRAYVELPLEAGNSSRLEGSLDPEQPANLHIDVPRNPGAFATVHIDVDGYPRAFTFRVPCHADSEGQLTEPIGVNILSPKKFESFLAPSDSLPVEVQVDAPRGAMVSPNNYVEVGIDEDMDRDFRGDRTIKLQSERQLGATLSAAGADGRFVIAATAQDHRLAAPASGLRNVRVNLLAQLRLGRVVAQDTIEDLWLDAQPPRLVVQDVAPGLVVEAESPVTVTMNVVDETRGFAKSVQAAFDKQGKGAFDPDAPPVEGVKQQGIAWQVEVPTMGLKPGRHTLLLRATDHLGNASDYISMSITIVPPTPDNGLGKIGGIVSYRGSPAAEADLLLEPEDATVQLKVNEAQSGDQGAFAFEELPPGKYRVVARLLRRNARLKLEQDVEVEDPPKKPKFLQFDFK